MATVGAEAERQAFLARFLPGGQPPLVAPPLPAAAWDAVQADEAVCPQLAAELWTSRPRQAANRHERSRRACDKPQRPRHSLERVPREA